MSLVDPRYHAPAKEHSSESTEMYFVNPLIVFIVPARRGALCARLGALQWPIPTTIAGPLVKDNTSWEALLNRVTQTPLPCYPAPSPALRHTRR